MASYDGAINHNVVNTSVSPTVKRKTANKWTEEEDKRLTHLVNSSWKTSWSIISQQMPDRTAKQCRERYVNNLDPDRKKGAWTEEEDEIIMKLQAELGTQWSKISAVLPGRNDNDVKNRFHTKVNTYRGSRSKKRKEGGGTESDGKRDKKKRKQTPSPHIVENPTDDMIPEVGMRAQVKYGGIAKGGEIVQIIKRNLFYNLVIRYDNGETGETLYPGSYIKLIPNQSNLSDSEVALCHDLLGLQGSFKSPESKPEARKQEPSSGETSKQSSCQEEEYDDYLYEYIAIKAKGGFDSMQDDDDEEEDDDTSEVVTSGDSADSNQAGESGDAIDLLCGKVFNSMQQKPKALKPKSPISKPYTVPTWAKAKKLPTSKGRGTSSESKRLSKTKKPHGLLSDAQAQYQYAHGNGKWPMSDILEPGLNDVLVGRGGHTNHHPGNVRWRQIVEDLKPEYKACSRIEKGDVAMKVLKEWRAQDPPGRFIKKDDNTGLWNDIGDNDARVKCSQVLRELKASKLTLDDPRCSNYVRFTLNDSAQEHDIKNDVEAPKSDHYSVTKPPPFLQGDLAPKVHIPNKSTRLTQDADDASIDSKSTDRKQSIRVSSEQSPAILHESRVPTKKETAKKSSKVVRPKLPMRKNKKAKAKKPRKASGGGLLVSAYDVISGRGGHTNLHAGNRRFRDEARALRGVYSQTDREKKKAISLELVKRVTDYGGRFLRQHSDELWYEMDLKDARKKCSQVLRENKWD